MTTEIQIKKKNITRNISKQMHACHKQCVSPYYRQTNEKIKILINSDSEEQYRGGKGSTVNYTSHIS